MECVDGVEVAHLQGEEQLAVDKLDMGVALLDGAAHRFADNILARLIVLAFGVIIGMRDNKDRQFGMSGGDG